MHDVFPYACPSSSFSCLPTPEFATHTPIYHGRKAKHEGPQKNYLRATHRRRVTQKGGMQHEDFPGGHPS